MKKHHSVTTLLALLAILVLFSLHAHSLNFTQDDAYIFYRYAKNYADGQGLVFNAGERVEGYTSFSWTVILALAIRLGFDPVLISKILGFIFSIGSIGMLFLISKCISRERPFVFNVLAALMIACNGSFAMWTLSGMETSLFVFLILAGIYAYLSEQYRNGTVLATSVLFALASLTRPEGLLLFGLTFFHRLFSSHRSKRFHRKEHIRYVGLFAMLLLPHLLWRISYYGYPLPNTFYAKTGLSWPYLKMGLEYTAAFLRSYALFGAALAIPPVVLLFRKERSWYGYFVFILIAYMVYITSIGGDVLLENRFYMPVFFIMYLLVQETLYNVYLRLRGKKSSHGEGKKSMALAVVLLLALAYSAWTYSFPRSSILSSKKLMEGVVDKYTKIADWLTNQGGTDISLATTGVGAISYFTDIHVIDMYGMTDSYIAHHPEAIEGLTSSTKEQKYNASYVMNRKPQYIYFITNDKPAALAEKALFTRPEFRQGYYLYWINANFGIYRRKNEYSPKPVDVTRFESVQFIEEYHKGCNYKFSDPEKAIQHLQRAIDLGPQDFAYPYEQIGSLYLNRGLLDEASGYFHEAIRIDDFCANSHTGLGAISLTKGDMDKALLHLEKAVSLWPLYNLAHYYLGSTYAALSRFDEAVSQFHMALKLDRNDPKPYEQLGFLYANQLNDPQTAMQYFEQYLRLRPEGQQSQHIKEKMNEMKGNR